MGVELAKCTTSSLVRGIDSTYESCLDIFPTATTVGEYWMNACELALRLWRHIPKKDVGYFNLYGPLTYEVFERLDSPLVVFTTCAIEQLLGSTRIDFFDIGRRDK